MPGKHAPESPRSFYVSLARAGGAALGAVGLMVVAVVVIVSRGGPEPKGLPVVSSPTSSASRTPAARTPTPKTSASPTALPANRVTVDVRNGTTRNGLAREFRAKVLNEGYTVSGVGNTSRFAKSTILYRPGRRLEALAFQQGFPEFTVLKQATTTGGAMLRVVLGADYP